MSQSSLVSRKRDRSPPSPAALPPPKSPPASPPQPNFIGSTKNPRCVLPFRGVRVDHVNLTLGDDGPALVDSTVFDHGNFNCCWATIANCTSHAAFLKDGHMLPIFSTQFLLDFVYPTGTNVGNVACGLHYIKEEGTMLDDSYKRPFTGEIPMKRPGKPSGMKYKIKDWIPVDDNEEQIIAALDARRTLAISIPTFPIFNDYEGDDLLDLSEVELNYLDKHENLNAYKPPMRHSVLLVGYGTCTLTDPGVNGLKVGYWIIKNIWGTRFGRDGLGYIIRHSSLVELHNCADNEVEQEKLRSEFMPYYAIKGDEVDVKYSPSIHVLDVENEDEGVRSFHDSMQKMSDENYRDSILVYMLYDSRYREELHVLEVFHALGKTFHHDKTAEVHIINVRNCQKEARSAFKLKQDLKKAVFVRLAGDGDGDENWSSCHRFKGVFSLPRLLMWIEDMEPDVVMDL